MAASAIVARMTTAPTPPTFTTYRVNLHTPRKPSPLNPAAHKPSLPKTSDERQSRRMSGDEAQREGSRRARTVSPTQKILRRKAAKTLQNNTLRRQVEAYEARALQGLATKASTASSPNMTKKGKGKDTIEPTFKIGITVTSTTTNHQPSRKKRRRRWGSILMFFRARPVVAALGSLWPFESRRTQEQLAWHPTEPQSPVAAAPAA